MPRGSARSSDSAYGLHDAGARNRSLQRPLMAGYVMRIEAHKLRLIWKETNTRLDVLAGRVREGVEVLAASDFARWLNFSGIIQIFVQNPSTRKYLAPRSRF